MTVIPLQLRELVLIHGLCGRAGTQQSIYRQVSIPNHSKKIGILRLNLFYLFFLIDKQFVLSRELQIQAEP